jgi:ATP-dependent protease ClpP protease subunit
MQLASFDWNWDHSIMVDDEISDNLVVKLTPAILRLKQAGARTITVGINSPGGNIEAANSLLSLLKAPGPDGATTTVITVAVDKAYSAAASLLALGDYAVALPSARIHYHDVRFSTFFDLTSAKAVEAARELQRANDRMALRLADSVVERLGWLLIFIAPSFDQAKKDFPALLTEVDELGLSEIWEAGGPRLDFGGFICSQFAYTSPEGDALIHAALKKLRSWRKLEIAYREFNKANQPETNAAALFRDDNPLVTIVNNGVDGNAKFTWSGRENLKSDLVLLMLLLLRKAPGNPALRLTESVIADLMAEYSFFKEIRQKKHVDSVVNLLLQHDFALFEDFVGEQIANAKSEDERDALLGVLFPQAQVFWAYVVLMCRSLFDGEHPISVTDALFLGLIDEVAGRGAPRTKREARNDRLQRERQTVFARPARKWLSPGTKEMRYLLKRKSGHSIR